jgi:formylglycine-generating enzyme required for sulfatase activity
MRFMPIPIVASLCLLAAWACADEKQEPTAKLEVIEDGVGIKLVRIPGGSFVMGSEKGFDDEVPVHRVTISKPFYLGQTEVTQAQYEAVMEENPSQSQADDLPVDTVSWQKATEFCKKLSEREGKRYRLPTEAEWEYACRAGGDGDFGRGEGGVEVTESSIGDYAWFRLNSEATSPVGRKKPNAWGLYDMHGNVFEWVQDNWLAYPKKATTDPLAVATAQQKLNKGEWYVLRGGSWEWGVDNGKAASRCRCKKTLRSRTVGFRVAREVE